MKRLHCRGAPYLETRHAHTHTRTHALPGIASTHMMSGAVGVSHLVSRKTCTTNGAIIEWRRLKTPITPGVVYKHCTQSTSRGLQVRMIQCTRRQVSGQKPSQFLPYTCAFGASKYKIADELDDKWRRLAHVCKRARKRGTPEARDQRAQTRSLQRQVEEAEVSFAPGGAEFAKLAEHFKQLSQLCNE